MHFSKGSVVFASSPQNISKELQKEIQSNLNLDKPLLEQYFSWLKRALSFDFGHSLLSGQSVNELLKEAFPNSLRLALTALVLLFLLSIFLALLSLMYENSFFDKALNALCLSFFALPSFAISLVLILFFSVYLGILPSSGTSKPFFEESLNDLFLHLILPVLALVLSHLALFLRIARTSFKQSLNQSFIEAAFARGLSKKRIYFHFVLKDALSPIITYFGASAVGFLMNAYVIEQVFSYAGVGALFIESVLFKDYPVILALSVLSIFAVVFINLLTELLAMMINPRKALI